MAVFQFLLSFGYYFGQTYFSKASKNGEKQITLMQHFFKISKSQNTENIKEQLTPTLTF